MLTMYGISQCDTIKKAKAWLDAHNIPYQFHDYKKQGLDPELLDQWLQQLSWEDLLNRRGTTWRKLPEDVRENINAESARALMLDNQSIIKRPLLADGDKYLLGFSEASYQAHFGK